MNVISTRNKHHSVSALSAVLKGISPDGGLFVPEHFPALDLEEVVEAALSGYTSVATLVMSKYFDIDASDLAGLLKRAYSRFDDPAVVPLRKLTGEQFIMELFHGPTLAFKDMALQVLPRLISTALEVERQDKDVLILTATSGDTGKAALEGFKDVPRTAIYVFYPEDGVAPMQRLQMITQEGGNTGVCAVKGNFDDAQTGVKNLFADKAFNERAAGMGMSLSSANSINIGRLIPQVAYYVYSYGKLVADGEVKRGQPVNFCVPTGNFGNILAAWYAMQMGIPVNKLICASNRNNVLTDFFKSGSYDIKRKFHKTMSPSMDILISSNLERLLFEISGRDDKATRHWMDALKSEGQYALTPTAVNELSKSFYADYCTEEETAAAIRQVFEKYGYLMDTHPAVAQRVYKKYLQNTGDSTPTLIASTAHPMKFTQDVLKAVSDVYEDDAFTAAQRLSEITGVAIPGQIRELANKKVLHPGSVAKDGLGGAVIDFLQQ